MDILFTNTKGINIIKKIAEFSSLYTNILDIKVSNIKTIKDILFMYFSEFLFPYNICKILFIILPPSNGYIGIKLNIINKIFEYIINCFSFSPIGILRRIRINNKFVIDPANAINIFLISNLFPLPIFVL